METKRQQKFGRQIQKDLSDIFQKEFKPLIKQEKSESENLDFPKPIFIKNKNHEYKKCTTGR